MPNATRAEGWRPVPGFAGYEASDRGRIRSVKRCHRGSAPRVLVTRPSGNTPYPTVTVYVQGRTRPANVHKLVALAWLGPRPEGLGVRHLDGDYANARVDNLAYGTQSENMLDKVRHGHHPGVNKTHCKHGHEFTPDNLLPVRSGKRVCRACNRDRCRKRRQ